MDFTGLRQCSWARRDRPVPGTGRRRPESLESVSVMAPYATPLEGTTVESRTGAVAWAIRHHSVSRPRSSNRTWRKLHLLVDAETHEIVASELTANDVDDASQVGPLLDQVEGPLALFTGDGAY